VGLILAFALVIYLSTYVHYRADLTEENRYSLTGSTEGLLESLDTTVVIDVFLTGELSSGLRKVRSSVDETIAQYRDLAGGQVEVNYIDPFDIEDDSLKVQFVDSLKRYGLNPFTQVAQEKKGTEQTQRLVIPGALVTSRNGTYPVNFLTGVSNPDEQSYYNNIESLLEYKFSNAIEKVTRTSVPLIAYALGNGQSLGYDAIEVLNMMTREYRLDTVNLKNVPYVHEDYKCLVILQPREKFTEDDKFKIDQYLMHGGTVFFAGDIVDASLDSLTIKGSCLAYDKGLDLTDLFFRYGVRVNPDVIQDFQATETTMVVGEAGGQPQMGNVKWTYWPVVTGGNHPVSKNLDPVMIKYGSSIDTVKAEGSRKQILLATSANAKRIKVPTIISFNNAKEIDINSFTEANIPVAVLVENQFKSFFANRLTQQRIDSFNSSGSNFLAASTGRPRLIVVSDGDAFLNEITQRGPLPVGMNKWVQFTFSNKDFFRNCLDYLVGTSGIFESRSKSFTLRLLDEEKVDSEKNKWQFINIGLPVVLILLLGLLLQWRRKRKYAA
jgi:gliding-associated putative ABC transporter substrate-binding component GldG